MNNLSIRFINLGSLMGPLPSKRLPQQTTLQQHVTLGPAQLPNDMPEERSSLRLEGLAKVGMTLASDSDLLFQPGIR